MSQISVVSLPRVIQPRWRVCENCTSRSTLLSNYLISLFSHVMWMLHQYQDFIYFNIWVLNCEESSVSTVTTSELDDQDPIPRSGRNSPFTTATLPLLEVRRGHRQVVLIQKRKDTMQVIKSYITYNRKIQGCMILKLVLVKQFNVVP